MPTYLNPGNGGFADIISGKYIDKTGLIAVLNNTISTPQKLTCISRPRRFGKSYAAQMLCAYYGRNVDSHELFDGRIISEASSYERHINAYDVIYIDMTTLIGKTEPETLISSLKQSITDEIVDYYPEVKICSAFDETLLNVVNYTGSKFIMIIDEWDAPIREMPQRTVDEYFIFLRMLFKSSSMTSRLFAAVYMTGILPIKKVKGQSAVSDFNEYTMLLPGQFAEYVGFTEDEVRKQCVKDDIDFHEMKHWYDGYELKNVGAIYNPNSVMKAIQYKTFVSYWPQTSAANNLLDFIRWDVDGLRQAIIELMGGVEIEIDTGGYDNDLEYTSRDAALTMFVHLGYLSFNQDAHTVRIPNEEIRLEFARALRKSGNSETMKRVKDSVQLIMDTVGKNCDAVAEGIRAAHMESSNPLNRNNENSLRAAIQVAYFAYKDYFIKLEELSTGKGYADIVYIPKKGLDIPILLVELKWNQDADTAIKQIREKRYVKSIEGFGGDVLLVGVSYDKKTGEYGCKIEEAVV